MFSETIDKPIPERSLRQSQFSCFIPPIFREESAEISRPTGPVFGGRTRDDGWDCFIQGKEAPEVQGPFTKVTERLFFPLSAALSVIIMEKSPTAGRDRQKGWNTGYQTQNVAFFFFQILSRTFFFSAGGGEGGGGNSSRSSVLHDKLHVSVCWEDKRKRRKMKGCTSHPEIIQFHGRMNRTSSLPLSTPPP